MLEQIADILTFTGAVFLAVSAALFLFYLYARAMQRYWNVKPASQEPEFDATQLTILFHSMRDTLRQQKQLAAEINETVERRVSYIRKTVDLALDELSRIDARQQELARTMDAMADDTPSHHSEPPMPTRNAHQANGNGNAPPTNGNGHGSDALQVVPPTQHTPFQVTSDPEASWVGLDFGRVDADAESAQDVPSPPTAPEDAEAARDAFRALLDMDESAAPAVAVSQSTGPNPAVHGRVYEYADAGMSIPAIARELGIGKGEVRLILGLRKDREA